MRFVWRRERFHKLTLQLAAVTTRRHVGEPGDLPVLVLMTDCPRFLLKVCLQDGDTAAVAEKLDDLQGRHARLQSSCRCVRESINVLFL